MPCLFEHLKHLAAAVLNGDGFVVTCSLTDAIKEGERICRIRVMHDPVGETLTVYWAEPRTEQVCEETGEGVILIRDVATGEVIGFERRFYRPEPGVQSITLETSQAASI